MFKKLEEIFALAGEADYEKDLLEIVKTLPEQDYEELMRQIALKSATYINGEREESLEERKEKKIMGMIAATKNDGYYLSSIDYFGCGCEGTILFKLINETVGKHSFYRAKKCGSHSSLDDYGFEESELCAWEGGRAGNRLAFNAKNFTAKGYSAGDDAFRESENVVANIDEIGERACYGAEKVILQAEEIKSFYQPKSRGIIIYREGNMIGSYDDTRKNLFLTTRYQAGDEKRGLYFIHHEAFRKLDVTTMSSGKVAHLLKTCGVRVPIWLNEKVAEEKAAKEKASAEKK